ncbi:hypothetical protein EJB05_14351, partial [Eragrostis curvula]
MADRTMAPPPELIDDVAGEIFLRLPPDEPEHLFRASLVCKPWLRVISDAAFLRRYRAYHRTPPLLGYARRRKAILEGDADPRLFPTTVVPLAPNPCFRQALDCHHGRVLLHAYEKDHWYLIVWDPITGDEHRVPDAAIHSLIYSAAVFCAVSGCDHLDCHGGPFRVVFIDTDGSDNLIKACIYSSETGAWSTPVALSDGWETYVKHRQDALNGEYYRSIPFVQPRRGAVLGDEIYFTLWEADAIIKYDCGKNFLFMINAPLQDADNIALMEMEDNSLGFVYIKCSRLYLWSRKANSEGAAEWMQFKVIELMKMTPVSSPDDNAFVVGCAEGVGVIFVTTGAGLFTIKVNSGQVKKIGKPEVYFSILPYMSFYTPDCGKIITRRGAVQLHLT